MKSYFASINPIAKVIRPLWPSSGKVGSNPQGPGPRGGPVRPPRLRAAPALLCSASAQPGSAPGSGPASPPAPAQPRHGSARLPSPHGMAASWGMAEPPRALLSPHPVLRREAPDDPRGSEFFQQWPGPASSRPGYNFNPFNAWIRLWIFRAPRNERNEEEFY